MPLVDKYDTQTAIELMRQHIDQKGWFDKVRHHACYIRHADGAGNLRPSTLWSAQRCAYHMAAASAVFLQPHLQPQMSVGTA